MTQKITIQYLFDPLCGWCYGASATIAELAQHDAIDLRPFATGLFSGHGARPMAGFAAQAWAHDQRISKLSGRTFSEAYRDKVLGAQDASLDSTIATLAVTAVADEAPNRVIEVLKAIQEARYVTGLDVTSASVVADLLDGLGLSQSAGRLRDPDAELKQSFQDRTKAASGLMAEFRLQGVPAMVVEAGGTRQPMDASALYSGSAGILKALGLADQLV